MWWVNARPSGGKWQVAQTTPSQHTTRGRFYKGHTRWRGHCPSMPTKTGSQLSLCKSYLHILLFLLHIIYTTKSIKFDMYNYWWWWVVLVCRDGFLQITIPKLWEWVWVNTWAYTLYLYKWTVFSLASCITCYICEYGGPKIIVILVMEK